jgi:hypothetical protein
MHAGLVLRSFLAAFVLATMIGCNCTERRIDVALAGALETAGESSPIAFTGGVSDSSAGGSFALLRRVVTNTAQSTEAHTIVWTMRETSGSPAAFLSFALRVPIAAGDVATVSIGSAGGGWGVLTGDPRPTPLSANVYFERGNFIPTIARGALTVVRTAPLEIDVDATFFNASGASIRLRGRAVFASTEFETACFE